MLTARAAPRRGEIAAAAHDEQPRAQWIAARLMGVRIGDFRRNS
jgi:hypothetical protein